MPRGRRLRGVGSKEQRQYEHIKESAQKSGRYGRRAKEVADEAKDNATSGLIDTWTDEAERRAWFLFEISR